MNLVTLAKKIIDMDEELRFLRIENEKLKNIVHENDNFIRESNSHYERSFVRVIDTLINKTNEETI